MPKRKVYAIENNGERFGCSSLWRLVQHWTTLFGNSVSAIRTIPAATHNGSERHTVHVFDTFLLQHHFDCRNTSEKELKKINLKTRKLQFKKRTTVHGVDEAAAALLNLEWLLFPINITDSHWYLLLADLHRSEFVQFDSWGPQSIKLSSHASLVVPLLMAILAKVWGLQGVDKWTSRRVKVPTQSDTETCGIWSLCFLVRLMQHGRTALLADYCDAWKLCVSVEVVREWLYYVLENIGEHMSSKRPRPMPTNTTERRVQPHKEMEEGVEVEGGGEEEQEAGRKGEE